MAIHETAVVSPKATLGNNVSIGAFTVIYNNVVIGDHCFVGAHCELGLETTLGDATPLIIGNNANIRSGSMASNSPHATSCVGGE